MRRDLLCGGFRIHGLDAKQYETRSAHRLRPGAPLDFDALVEMEAASVLVFDESREQLEFICVRGGKEDELMGRLASWGRDPTAAAWI